LDGSMLAAWPGVAPVRYFWDTSLATEGEHTLMARASSGPISVESDARAVLVDRTPPQLIAQRPSPGELRFDTSQPIEVTFSEPVLPDSVSGLQVTSGGASLAVQSSLTDPATVRIELQQIPSLPADFRVTLDSIR